jgi:hypothetical protein
VGVQVADVWKARKPGWANFSYAHVLEVECWAEWCVRQVPASRLKWVAATCCIRAQCQRLFAIACSAFSDSTHGPNLQAKYIVASRLGIVHEFVRVHTSDST